MDLKTRWDIRTLVYAMGGPDTYRASCLAYGYEVPPAANVYQWIKRKRAPADAVATMLLVHDKMRQDGKIQPGKGWWNFIKVYS